MVWIFRKNERANDLMYPISIGKARHLAHMNSNTQDTALKLNYEAEIWQQGNEFVAGVDEAGRGPLAGPVVAAAVIFNADLAKHVPIQIDDSKKLTERQRQRAYKWIIAEADAYGVGVVNADEIDRINIRQAAMLAMRKAIAALEIKPQHLLIDGHPIESPPFPQTSIIKGDSKSLSIAAASIVAKVVRDQIMQEYALDFPDYDFAKNKGYGTKRHISAILKKGLCPIHRHSFQPKQLKDSGIYGA